MKRSIRAIALFLALILTLSFALTACNQGNGGTTETTGGETTTEKPSKPPVEDNYHLDLEDGHNQLTFYWTYNGTYDDCDIWIWWGDKAGQGYTFHECPYGAKVVINVPEEITEVGFIVRRGCSDPGGSSWGSATKDYEQDRFAVIDGRETFIYLKSGDANQYTSTDGGKTLEMIKKFSIAGMTAENVIQYRVTPKTLISDISQVKVYEGDREIAVTEISTLGRESATGYVTVGETLDLSKNYRIEIDGFGSKHVVPTNIFDSDYFADNYHYDGNDLGATINGDQTTFKVWAPTASKVMLDLYSDGHGDTLIKSVEMTRGEKGVWSYTEACGHGTYYTYTVTTSVGTQTATDPYAKAAGLNGNRSMVVDLSKTDPEGWKSEDFKTGITNYSEATIWEIHVRDFSNKIASSQYKGKYLAFTERGLVNEHGKAVGVDYLVELGITHVHILPMYDFATIDEATPEDEFNWGYDPKNYNVPEGSYSTDPYNGEVRIKELKQMVQALHNAGIGVIMDVVYNHTYDANSSFNKIVPYYYYRYTNTGANSSASGCGNDTASERYMYGKFMVDSTSYWIEEYDLDGMRFDLMGLHDLATMQKVESAIHTINPEAIVYGEGWTMGSTIDGSAQANQSNISQIVPTGDAIGSIAVFNDAIRDGLKGSVFDKVSQGYISGESALNVSKVIFGIKGGKGSGTTWTVDDAMVINYMSAHDNNTLWDKLLLSNPDNSDDERNAMNKLGAAILMISKGTPFWQAGEEMLRTKNGDENSYKSSDEINNIDWSVLKDGSREYETMLYYKGLIEMRKAYSVFTEVDANVTCEELGSGVLKVELCGQSHRAVIFINPHSVTLPCQLDGEYSLIANESVAGAGVIATESGSQNVAPRSVRVYVEAAVTPVE